MPAYTSTLPVVALYSGNLGYSFGSSNNYSSNTNVPNATSTGEAIPTTSTAGRQFAIPETVNGLSDGPCAITWQTVITGSPTAVSVGLQLASVDADAQYQTVDTSTNTSGEIRTYGATAARFVRLIVNSSAGGTTPTIVGTISIIPNDTALSANNLTNGTTGTGSVVLANSPTLVTPTLGVASATSIYAPVGNLTTVNSTTGNITTVSGTNVTASGTVKAGVFAGQGSATIAAGSTTVTGTSPSLAVYGSGSSGEIIFTVGSSPSASGVIATIAFPTAYPSAPKAVIVPNGTSLPTGFSWSTSTTNMTLSCSSTMTAGAFYKFEYILIA